MYNLEAWKAGLSSLHPIELNVLGDVRGKSILHLQCHFGQDSMSLQRMGAKVMGVDISTEAINTARALNAELGLDCHFIESDILKLVLPEDISFDIVFASYGVLGWHPDPIPWMDVASRYTKPGGRMVYVEFHPVVWMHDDHFSKIAYSYFNDGGIEETTTSSYASVSERPALEYVSWNHSLSEIFNAMTTAGYRIDHFDEYDYSPYNIFQNATEKERKYYVKGLEHKLPLVYSISGVK